MSGIFIVLALLLGISILLYSAGDRKLLNFIDYSARQPAARINRYAALHLLLPAILNAECAWIAALRPDLAVPFLFLTRVSILWAVP